MAFNSVKGGLLITIQNVDEILLAIEFLIIKVFDVLVGLLKRDTRAPHPFIIVIDNINAIDGDLLDYGFTLSPARIRRLGAEKLANVQFADNVELSLVTLSKEPNYLKTGLRLMY